MGIFTLANAPIKKTYKTWHEKSISEFCESAEGLTLLGLCNAASGLDYSSLERYIVRDTIVSSNAYGSSNATLHSDGIVLAAAAGTLVGKAKSTTSIITKANRIGIESATGAGSLATLSQGVSNMYFGSNGGFTQISQFYCDDPATVDGARQFSGVIQTTAPTNVEPSTRPNCIGLGNGAADTNMSIYYGGSSAQTPIDLGANFPANTLTTDLYELAVFSFKELDTKAGYQVKRLNTGHVTRGILSAATAGVQLPAVTTGLMGYVATRTNNATALKVSFGFCRLFLGT